jgi:hypothetical protein
LNADPDPDPATQINADPCGSGSGSETLKNSMKEMRILDTIVTEILALGYCSVKKKKYADKITFSPRHMNNPRKRK